MTELKTFSAAMVLWVLVALIKKILLALGRLRVLVREGGSLLVHPHRSIKQVSSFFSLPGELGGMGAALLGQFSA